MKLEIEGKRVKIRKLKFSDAKDIYENVKDKEIVRWTSNIPHPYPKDGAIKFIRQTHYRIKNNKAYEFGIILKETNRLVGIIGLVRIDQKNKNGEIGYWLGKKCWGQGLTTEAAKLVLNFSFKELRLHKIYARLFEQNASSKRVLEKSGFKLEGEIRETMYRNRKWRNVLRYGMLISEYKKYITL